MQKGIIGSIRDFFYSINSMLTNSTSLIAKIDLFVSVGSILLIIILFLIAYGLYKRQLRISNIKKMIFEISSLDLLFYSLEKHFNTWKDDKEKSPNPEAAEFWKVVDLTATVSKMEELKIISNIYSKQAIDLEIISLLEFMGDLIIISFNGEDLSGKDYGEKNIITSDELLIKINNLTGQLSRSIGIKLNKTPDKNNINKYIKQHYIK